MLKRKVSTYCKNDARFQFFFLSPASRLKGGTEKVQRVVARAREQGDIETDEGYDGGRSIGEHECILVSTISTTVHESGGFHMD